jgi:hypothetical protein
MAKEILTLEVKSDIKNATQDLNDLSISLKEAVSLEAELTSEIKLKNGVIIDLERDLIKLKATQDSIPKGEYWKGQKKLADEIRDVTTEINLERNALKDLKNQQRDTNDEIKDTETNIKGITAANKAGVVPAGIFRVALRGIGTALKAMGIGLLISAILLLKRAFQSNETVMKAVNKITTTMSNLISDVIDGFMDVYKWVGESSDRFDAMQTVLKNLVTLGLTPIKSAFYGLKLAVENVMLGFFKLRKFLGMEGAAERIIEIKASIIETRIALGEVFVDASGAIVSIINNIGEAYDEFGNVIKKVKGELSTVELDPKKRKGKDDAPKGKPEKTAEEIALEKKIALEKELMDLETERTNQLIEDAARLVDEYYDTLNTAEQNQRNAVEDKYFAIIEGRKEMMEEIGDIDKGFSEKEIEEKEAINAQIIELKKAQAAEIKKIDDKSLKDEEAIADAKKKLQLQFVSIVGDSMGVLSSLAKEGSAEQKALALTEIAIGTGVGFIQALDIAQKSSKAAGPLAAFAFPIFYATQVLAILAAVASAKQALGSAGGGGSTSTPSASSAPPAPQMMSGAFELTGGQEIEPVQAYVVSDEITAAQNTIEIIRRRATI